MIPTLPEIALPVTYKLHLNNLSPISVTKGFKGRCDKNVKFVLRDVPFRILYGFVIDGFFFRSTFLKGTVRLNKFDP